MYRKIKPTKPVMPNFSLYVNEIESIWKSGILTNNGEKVEKLKKMLIDYLHHSNIDLFVNGHSSLMIAIKALGLKGKVITSPFTFVSTTNAIVQNGLTPIFADVDESYNIDPNGIEEVITPDTCAIITPHIFGIPCDVKKIDKIAERHNLKVIYDGAQAFGTKIDGKSIGKFGDITMFSFHAIKVFNSIEGGMLTYQNPDLHRVFELYRNFGIAYDSDDVDVIGINAKMNEFQAAMGIVNLPEIEKEIAKRRKISDMYSERLKDIPGIKTYSYQSDIQYNYAYFPIKVYKAEYGMDRDELWNKLKEKGVGTRKLYDKLTSDYKCYRDGNFIKNVVYANKLKNYSLDLPIYGELQVDDIEYICNLISERG